MGVNGIWYGTYPLVSNPLVSLVVGKEMNSTFPSALVKFTKRASKELWNIMEHPTILISDPGAAKGQRPQWGTNFFSADCGMVTVNWPPVSSPQRVGNKPTWWSKAAWSRPLKSGNQDWVWNGGKGMINQWRNGVLCDTQNDEQQEQPVLLATSESVVHGSPRFFVFHAFSFSFTVVYSTYCTILASQHTYPVGNGKSPSIYSEPANTANKLQKC